MHSITHALIPTAELLRDMAKVRGEVPQLVEQRVGGRALGAIRFRHEGGKGIPAGPVQSILAHLFLRTHFVCEPRGGHGTLNVHVSAALSHESVRQQEAILEDGQDVSPGVVKMPVERAYALCLPPLTPLVQAERRETKKQAQQTSR